MRRFVFCVLFRTAAYFQTCPDSSNEKHLQTFTTLKSPKSHKKFLHSHLYNTVSLVSYRSPSPLKVKTKVRTECRRRLIYRSSPVYFLLKSVFAPALHPLATGAAILCYCHMSERRRPPASQACKSLIGPGPFQVGEPAA